MNVLQIPEEWARTVRVVTSATPDDLQRYLSDAEIARAESFPREKRRQEWTASRIAVKLLVLERGLCDDPRICSVVSSYRKPTLAINGSRQAMNVSISHSEGAGGAAIAEQPIGLDIQKVRPLNPRATKFFLKDEELDQMNRVSIRERIFHFWCAKEAAFKLRAGPGWLKRVTIDLTDETPDGLTFDLSYPVKGTVSTFTMSDGFTGAVARQLIS